METLKHLLLGLVAFVCMDMNAANWLYWKGGDGNWSDPAHWEAGVAPLSGDNVVSFRETTEATVNIDTDVFLNYWSLAPQAAGEPVTTIEWIGNGSINNTTTSTSWVLPGRRLVLNGPYVYVRRNLCVTNSELVVKSGRLASGNVDNYSILVKDNGILRLEGGCIDTYGISLESGGAFYFAGGTLRYGLTLSNPPASYLPPAGCVLDMTQTKNVAGIQFTSAGGGSRSFSGTIIVTNSTASAHRSIEFYKTDYTLSGDGTIIADQLGMNNGWTATLKIKKVVLKSGFGVNATQSKFYFPEGVEFGAIGDWNDGSVVPEVRLAGKVRFDTLGHLDRSTLHTIQMKNCKDYGMTSLDVTGGGTVDLAFSAGISRLESLHVGAGTTLALTNTASCVVVERLVMDAGAKLLMTAGKGWIECNDASGVDATAEIRFALSASPTAGKRHPVWISETSVPDNLSVSGLDGTVWSEKNVSGALYLTDGTAGAVTQTGTSSDREWTGEASSSWSDTNNWYNCQTLLHPSGAPYGTLQIYVGQDLNHFIDYDFPGDSQGRYKGQFRQMTFRDSCGPYFMSGGTLAPLYGSAGSFTFKSLSQFPVVISNYVNLSSTDNIMFLCSDGKSYVSLLGGGRSTAYLYYRGDIRLGGNWTASHLVLNTSSTPRASRLTVLSGGTLTLADSSKSTSAPANVSVCGTLDVSNTLTSVGTANWRGDGVVKLHGVDASATAAFALGDSLRLYPMEGWATVPADAPAAAVTISAKETPTLGARCDWTYGPAAGAEPETADTDRALVVVKGATLTIDTEDPETGVGHTITFADPIFAEGDVVKAGAGTLAFVSSDSVIKGSFRLTGGEVALSGGLADAAKSAWVPVVAASSFEGLDAAMSPLYRRRVVAREDGLFQLEVREAVGAVLILR